ncbi:helix-turn-helix transcriptional regulator [Raoultibacter massiliensis]|uniref:LuxR C-terminal-related transcriptional regulator n=1 Tax=Raoultibacter massiliensis TaxID=1852371 RepID=A0ABV1JDC7_9ACTN|nr:LuxR C-terminal-related transcriptional regulator [Raoultibacter massiliensis]
MSKARKASLMALAALVLVGIWVDITGYLDVFSSPSATSHSQEIAHYACYAGRIAMAAAFLLFPRQLNCPLERSVPLMLCCMVGGTMLYSFGFHQSLFDPQFVAAAGSALIGVGHIWIVSSIYLYLMGVCGKREALYVLVAAQIAERILVEVLNSLLTDASLIVWSYLLPIATACVLAVSNRMLVRYRIVRDEKPDADQRGSVRAYFVTLCVMCGIGLVACGAMSTVGIWGKAGTGQFAGEGEQLVTALVECLIVVLCCRATFIASCEKPLALRYQSSLLVLVTGFVLMSSRQLLVPVPEELVNSLLVAIENYAHILFWVVALDAARSLGWPAYRSFGVGLVSCSMTGLAWSFFLEHHVIAAESAVFVVFYLLLVVCIVYPQVFNRVNMRSSSDEGAINEFALQGEQRLDAGVNGRALKLALEQRCAHVAEDYGLSAREGEVLVLLVKGDTRQNMCKTLQLSEGTVKTHLTHIYDKLNIHSRTELLEIVYDAEAGRG